ncbi:uncharacterized protein LOC110098377 [Dendrobium catenatum]|uniref:uncharacterized protein LOC110098377 n=1 Tax=Dendrobium catenatum TaxID=906689 RepID=UPI0009F57EC9|nr:uncharacterized protein LOC110098377 [Dendrobium catenatum]
MSEDGSIVKLFDPTVKGNSDKLQCSIVVKVFGRRNPIQLIAAELRCQWQKFGKFHLTILGSDWVLCSFFSEETMENVFSGGPWFVNGHIIGLDKWNSDFNPNSLKGLSSPIWIRMPNLPLYYWDEINLSRIASSIGKPILIDGDMFQWGRREFSRVGVRVQLDRQLPTGVWVEGINGKFYQKVEYKKNSSFRYKCGKIGHLKEACKVYEENKDA